MRKIKLRSWDKKRKIMSIVSWIDFSIQKLIYRHPTETFGRDDEPTPIREHFHNIIIMQYTGRKDKNDKEIFGGDWIKCEQRDTAIICYQGHVFYSEKEACYCIAIKGDEENYLFLHTVHCIEIIGNIYKDAVKLGLKRKKG